MAKQLINPVERHFEKGVLGVACLVLIGVIVQFLVTSPNQLEIDGQKVTPGTIDDRLAQKASSIQDLIRNANVDVDVPEALYPSFTTTLSPIKKTTLPTVVAIRPDIPQVDQAGSLVGQAKLVDVYQMSKPSITTGRSTFEVLQNLDDLSFMTSNWATVSSLFDVKQQTELQRLSYGANRADVLFGPVELQRRQRRPDGSWSEDDWDYINPWPVYDLDPGPQISIINKNGKSSISREVENRIEDYVKSLEVDATQLDLLRYLFPHTVINGTPWSFPILATKSYRDVLMQDDEYLFPNEPPAASPEDRYGLGGAAGDDKNKVLTKIQQYEQDLKEGYRFLELAKKNHSANDAARAFNKAGKIIRENPSPALVNKAKKLKAEAELAEQNAKIWNRNNRNVQAFNAGPVRQRLPDQQLWANDALAGSIQSGETYQYRIRALIYNRMAGEPLKFANPEDAASVYIPGPWSDPSDAVTIPPDLEFFITSADNKRQEIGVEMYRWFQGEWVKSRRFKFKVGDPIDGDSNVQIPSMDIVGDNIRATADFDSHATVIDIDFNRSSRSRKSGRSRSGVKFGKPSQETAVVFVDRSGNLHERTILTEKGHPSKKAAKGRLYQP